MTGQEAVTAAIQVLKDGGIDAPARDARRLFAAVIGVDAARLTLVLGDPVTAAQHEAFVRLVARRARREPVSHLIGSRSFYGRDFEVGPDVLDPRPETEVLVAQALSAPFTRVLDLGTGSGCILLTLLAETGVGTFGIGTDLSAAALAVAHRNAARVAVQDRVQFYHGDWFAAVPQGQAQVDLIVSNPPYIAADEMVGLDADVRDFEPRMALTDEACGLSAYRIITKGAQARLVQGGWLRVEIGPTQGAAVQQMMVDAGFVKVAVTHDFDGRDRVVSGKKPRK